MFGAFKLKIVVIAEALDRMTVQEPVLIEGLALEFDGRFLSRAHRRTWRLIQFCFAFGSVGLAKSAVVVFVHPRQRYGVVHNVQYLRQRKLCFKRCSSFGAGPYFLSRVSPHMSSLSV